MVRLKAIDLSGGTNAAMFQFLMVRLKARQVDFPDYKSIEFQFLMVRLKAAVMMSVYQPEFVVSIPYGSIKRQIQKCFD